MFSCIVVVQVFHLIFCDVVYNVLVVDVGLEVVVYVWKLIEDLQERSFTVFQDGNIRVCLKVVHND